MTTIAQRAFSNGEISPGRYARTDTEKYHTSLRTCRNFIVMQDGGATNRPGSKYIAAVKSSTAAKRLIKFVNETSYVIELGNLYMRFYQNGAQVTVAPAAWADATDYAVGDTVESGGVNYYCKLAHTSATAVDEPGVDAGAATKWYTLTDDILEIPTPYATSELSTLYIEQQQNTITICHPNHKQRELELANGLWSLAEITFQPSISKPTSVAGTGGSAAAADVYWAVTAVKAGSFEESLATIFNDNIEGSEATPVDLTWNNVTGAVSYNVYRSLDGGQRYDFIGSVAASTTEVTENTFSDASETASSIVSPSTTVAAGQVRNALTFASTKAIDGKYRINIETTLQRTGGLSTGSASGTVAVYYKRDAETRVLYSEYSLDDPLGAGPGPETNGANAHEIEIIVPDNGYTALEIDIVPTLVVESGGTGSWSYQVDGIDIQFIAGATSFEDDGGEGDETVGPPTDQNLFNAAGDYPSCVGTYQQRRFYAGTNNNPDTVYGSKVGSPHNFCLSTPLQPDDPITFRATSSRAGRMRHMLDLTRLALFTSASEKIVEGNGDGEVRPDAINPRNHSYNGANTLPPIPVDNRALYVQALSNSVRMIKRDDIEGSISANLNLDATHLFEGYTLTDWDYALHPFNTIWVVRSDGTLLGLTYTPELEEWGWHRHDMTNGFVENVCVVPEGNESAVYLIVRRTISGNTVRYVERFASRIFSDESDAWFVDCGKKYEGVAINTMTGLEHLNGQNVAIYADGQVRATPNDAALTVRTVAGGSVALGGNYTEVLVGLPITAELETLDIDSTGKETIKSDHILTKRVLVSMYRTRRLQAGATDQALSEFDYKTGEVAATSVISDTRKVRSAQQWNNNGRVRVRQIYPLPATVLMIAADLHSDGE